MDRTEASGVKSSDLKRTELDPLRPLIMFLDIVSIFQPILAFFFSSPFFF